MRVSGVRRAAAAVAVTGACAGAAGMLAVGASASHADRQDDGAATITMASSGKNLFFQGPAKVAAGSQLTITNATDPTKVGPHTFTLVDKDELPKSNAEIKDCFKLKTEFCLGIAKDHKVNLKTGAVGRPDLDVGKKGWDTPYGKKGDSWVAEAEGDLTSREVTAKPGSYYYFCVVHPFMQGKIKVTK
jgi:plastocyanin